MHVCLLRVIYFLGYDNHNHPNIRTSITTTPLILHWRVTFRKLHTSISKQSVFWAKQVYPSGNQSLIPTLLKVPAVYQMLTLFRFLWSMTSTFCRQVCEQFLIFTSTTADPAFTLEERPQLFSVKLIAPNFI